MCAPDHQDYETTYEFVHFFLGEIDGGNKRSATYILCSLPQLQLISRITFLTIICFCPFACLCHILASLFIYLCQNSILAYVEKDYFPCRGFRNILIPQIPFLTAVKMYFSASLWEENAWAKIPQFLSKSWKISLQEPFMHLEFWGCALIIEHSNSKFVACCRLLNSCLATSFPFCLHGTSEIPFQIGVLPFFRVQSEGINIIC